MIPHYFSKLDVPSITNPSLLEAIREVKSSKNQQQALEKAFTLITSRFKGYRFQTYLYIHKVLEKDPNKLWNRQGFMHCTHQNYLLRLLLVSSGWFSEADIKLCRSLVWYVSPHQYLRVNVGDTWVAVDPWNANYGATIGQYASGFGLKN